MSRYTATVIVRPVRRGPFHFLVWGPRGVRPLGHLQAAYHSKQPWALSWWIRVAVWVSMSALVERLVGVRFLGAGPLAFEVMLFATGAVWQRWCFRRQMKARPGAGGHDQGLADDAGVREPRRPTPLAGAGAVALPLPDPFDDRAGSPIPPDFV